MTSRKVLLVDDSPLVRAVVAHALGGAGFEVAAIEDPTGIAAEVTRFGPDLLLVDATYPGITDDRLVELVTVHAGSLPVVLFSDRSAPELEGLSKRIGARGFVPKDAATLADRLRAY